METYEPDSDGQHAMQTRCHHCLGEQYVLNAIFFSAGDAGCSRCGKLTTPMTYEQWYGKLREARARLQS